MPTEQEVLDRVRDNVRLVTHISSEFAPDRELREELISEGYVALVQAAQNFDANRGVKFSTYAGRCIKNKMLYLMRRRGVRHRREIVSLDKPLFIDDQGREVPIRSRYSVRDNYPIFQDTLYQEVRRAVAELSRAERRMIELVYAPEGTRTQRSVANQLGCSTSYVSRVVRRARRKIREILLEKGVM